MASFWIVLILKLIASAMAAPTYLNLTAVSAAHGFSTLECWQLPTPFTISSEPGAVGAATAQLGNVSSFSYSRVPAGFRGSIHRAPAVQYVLFLSGLAHVTLPNSTQEAWIRGGKNGLVFAADTAAVSGNGHITDYPGETETTLLQIPTAGGEVPDHRVLHEGACLRREVDL